MKKNKNKSQIKEQKKKRVKKPVKTSRLDRLMKVSKLILLIVKWCFHFNLFFILVIWML